VVASGDFVTAILGDEPGEPAVLIAAVLAVHLKGICNGDCSASAQDAAKFGRALPPISGNTRERGNESAFEGLRRLLEGRSKLPNEKGEGVGSYACVGETRERTFPTRVRSPAIDPFYTNSAVLPALRKLWNKNRPDRHSQGLRPFN
jgi:hypothetical protein